ncbi:hypothetical protein N0V82_009505 [Gnomoniopsis sp. IMI 355080]|nr:hypothetical protein N0V82_009505 [Gnomoniopsis sp. IMI 355080]
MASDDGKSSPLLCNQPTRLETMQTRSASDPPMGLHIISPTRPGIRQLCLEDLPLDILYLVLNQLPRRLGIRQTTANHRLFWMLQYLKKDKSIYLSRRQLRNLAHTSRSLYWVTMPYLYRVIHVSDVTVMLKLWTTLRRWRPQNAAYIHHLYFSVELDNYAVIASAQMWAGAQDLPLADPEFCPRLSRNAREQQPREPFVWADGEPLLASHFSPSRAPYMSQRIYFDIIGRSAHLQSFSMMPPSHTDTNATFLFRQALAALTSPSLLRPTQALQHLQGITIHIEDRCPKFLSRYGTLVMPTLEGLTLITTKVSWLIKFRGEPDRVRKAAMLQRAHSLIVIQNIIPAHADLDIDLESLPNLLSLRIMPGVTIFPRVFPTSWIYFNQMLAQHGHMLRDFELSWTIAMPTTLPPPHLRPIICLTCLPALQSLINLTVSTKMLFGSLRHLQYLLRPPSAILQNPHKPNPEPPIITFLQGALPPALQSLTLVETWCPTEFGLYDEQQRGVRLMTWHGHGDWMEARLADEMILAGGGGETTVGNDDVDTASLRAAIRAPHEIAMLGLVGALRSVWLPGGWPATWVLIVQPERLGWYEAFVHPVVVAEAERTSFWKKVHVRYKKMPRSMQYSFVEGV